MVLNEVNFATITKLYEDAMYNHLLTQGYSDFEAKRYAKQIVSENNQHLFFDFDHHRSKKQIQKEKPNHQEW